MAQTANLRPGTKVRVIDPEDGYYLSEGAVEDVRGRAVYVRFAEDDTGQEFKAGQLKVIEDELE
jgi:hypothetical protein